MSRLPSCDWVRLAGRRCSRYLRRLVKTLLGEARQRVDRLLTERLGVGEVEGGRAPSRNPGVLVKVEVALRGWEIVEGAARRAAVVNDRAAAAARVAVGLAMLLDENRCRLRLGQIDDVVDRVGRIVVLTG